MCTHERPALLRNCLASLTRQTYSRFDVLVIESGLAQSAHEISRAFGAGYLHDPVAGISRARNAGVKAARGDIVAFIDDDATAEPGWLDTLAAPFCDPAIGAVTGGTRYMKSYGVDRLMSGEVEQEPFRAQRRFSRSDKDWIAMACFGGIGDGMNMAFRRSLVLEQCRFDERLGRGQILDGGDEHVAFLSVLAGNHQIMHVPTSVVRHPFPADEDARAAFHRTLLRNSMAYILFLWVEFPRYRTALARFLLARLSKRMWARDDIVAPASCPNRRLLMAALLGPALYLRARRSWSRTHEVPARAAVQLRDRKKGSRWARA